MVPVPQQKLGSLNNILDNKTDLQMTQQTLL